MNVSKIIPLFCTISVVLTTLTWSEIAFGQFPSTTHRVVRGRLATNSDILATVAISRHTHPNRPFCTGTLVASNIVMTAAHCLESDDNSSVWPPSKLRVVVGVLNTSEASTGDIYPVTKIDVDCDYYNHGFDPSTEPATDDGDDVVDNSGLLDTGGLDIAFLRLGRHVPSSVMTPVPILPANRMSELQTDTEVHVVGYGITLEGPRPKTTGILYTADLFIQRITCLLYTSDAADE